MKFCDRVICTCHDYLLAEINWSKLVDLASIIKTDFLFIFTQSFYNFIAINITFNSDSIIRFCLRHSTVSKSINVLLINAIITIAQIVNNSLFEIFVSRTTQQLKHQHFVSFNLSIDYHDRQHRFYYDFLVTKQWTVYSKQKLKYHISFWSLVDRIRIDLTLLSCQ